MLGLSSSGTPPPWWAPKAVEFLRYEDGGSWHRTRGLELRKDIVRYQIRKHL